MISHRHPGEIASDAASGLAVNKAYVDAKVGDPLIATILETLYPVGSIYIGVMDECPLAALFGTWTKIEGRYLLASGSLVGGSEKESYSAGNTAEAGLPNITGTFGRTASSYRAGIELHTDGVFSSLQNASAIYVEYGKDAFDSFDVSFDASKSNDTYSKSQTVRPPSYCVNVWRRES